MEGLGQTARIGMDSAARAVGAQKVERGRLMRGEDGWWLVMWAPTNERRAAYER